MSVYNTPAELVFFFQESNPSPSCTESSPVVDFQIRSPVTTGSNSGFPSVPRQYCIQSTFFDCKL